MDGQLITLGSAPAHVVPGGRRLNAAAQAGIQSSFAVLKFKSKVWRIRYRGEEQVLEDSPGTGRDGRALPVAPVPTLDVVVVGASQAISKRWYAGGYNPDAEGKAPDCFSINGISPDPASAQKQAPMCATCPKNVWGSATMENGGKAKACQDRKRIAVVPANDVANPVYDGPMMLDIPPGSLKILKSYTDQLGRMGADLSQVVTRVGFNPLETLQLTFACVGWVQDPRDYALADEMTQSDQVHRMLNEEVVDVTADAEAHAALLGPRPAHLLARPSPAEAVKQEEPEKVEAPTPPEPQVAAVATSETATASAAAGGQARRPSPFATGRAAVASQAAPAPTPAPAKPTNGAAPAQAQPTIVQGAPASLEAEIDNLLSGC